MYPFLCTPMATQSRVLIRSYLGYFDGLWAGLSASSLFSSDPTYSQTLQWFSSNFIFFWSFACSAITGASVSLIYAHPTPSLAFGLSTNITPPRIPSHLHFSLPLTAAFLLPPAVSVCHLPHVICSFSSLYLSSWKPLTPWPTNSFLLSPSTCYFSSKFCSSPISSEIPS